ncbi:MAG TPA: hypothetical protein QGF95_07190 [Candidatus Latescibacteria bacterium]|jgi:hypothetical protein|nr:hypothetical protein [Gemmatimonadaceae bacterium]MDP7632145.1 hypothetical protein [Candidatus Latescibacterota bacterium]HJP30324.1 hypothetical protein [Candidatus Latescibacterota bacterium]|tara:strand:- start:67 stop:585 length:519 start_codon:yes stop_codon:yes gene_type:complete
MAIFDSLFGRKKKGPAFDPRVEITQLAAMSPPSTLVYMPSPGGDDEDPDDLGKAFFLRRDKKIYSEGANIYITSPDNVKSSSTDNTLNSKVIRLQFFSRRVPHNLECRVIGRFRLLPEVVETLDFNAKSAYKLRDNEFVNPAPGFPTTAVCASGRSGPHSGGCAGTSLPAAQ